MPFNFSARLRRIPFPSGRGVRCQPRSVARTFPFFPLDGFLYIGFGRQVLKAEANVVQNTARFKKVGIPLHFCGVPEAEKEALA